jgi:hypothetical protein
MSVHLVSFIFPDGFTTFWCGMTCPGFILFRIKADANCEINIHPPDIGQVKKSAKLFGPDNKAVKPDSKPDGRLLQVDQGKRKIHPIQGFHSVA